MSDDEFDNIPDEFADSANVDWDTILSGSQPTRPRSANSSTSYSVDDNIDSAFLAEVDRIEGSSSAVNLVAGSSISSETSVQNALQQPSPQCQNLLTYSSHYGKSRSEMATKSLKRSYPSFEIEFPNKKGKGRANDSLEDILSSYEEEMTCPICLGVFACAHAGNPCGHSFCGGCGWEWISKLKSRAKSCPNCRTTLDEKTPIIPNIVLDNMVTKYIQSLIVSGREDWKAGGSAYNEWSSRANRWKQENGKRVKALVRKPIKRTYVGALDIQELEAAGFGVVFDPWVVPDDDENEDTTYEEDEGLIPPPIPRFRRAR